MWGYVRTSCRHQAVSSPHIGFPGSCWVGDDVVCPAPLDTNTLEFIATNFQHTHFQSLYIAPVSTSHLKGKSSDELESLALRMTITLQKILMASLEVLPEPSPGVPELHAALTSVSSSAPLLNIHPATKITGLGLGGASLEAMLIDPQTQQVLYAVAFSRQAAKRVGSGLTKWDDAHAVVQAWAQELALLFQPDDTTEQHP